MPDTVLYDLQNGVATLTLNRPEVLNSFTEELLDELADCLEKIGDDDAVRAVILTGAGRAFSAGQDLNSTRASYDDGGRPDFRDILKGHHEVMSRIRELNKPVIAAVNGVAAGAGMSLACACDLRIAADNARFTTAFSKIGLVPDGGLAYTLPRLVGLSKATELIFFSEMVNAQDALEWRLVNRVVPADELLSAANEEATKLAAGPTLAYGLTKRLLDAGSTRDFDSLLGYEADLQDEAGDSEDHKAAVKAFLNKQQAVFSGR